MKALILKSIGIFTLSLIMITVVTHIFAVSSEHRAIISNVNVAVNVTIYAIAYIKRNALKCFCAKMIAKHKWRFETIKRMIKEA